MKIKKSISLQTIKITIHIKIKIVIAIDKSSIKLNKKRTKFNIKIIN